MANYYDKIKICNVCKLEKDLDMFRKRKTPKDSYRNSCKSCESIQSKKYYDKNKLNLKEKNKQWRINNPDKVKEILKRFLLKNPEYVRKYTINSRDKINKRYKDRRDTDINFKLKENIRNLIKNSLNYKNIKKNQRTNKILGCTNDDFKLHLESQFESWMTWDNYGNPKDGILQPDKTWDIDHIIPLNTAITEDELIKLNHYTNLKPLCSYVNRITKRGKLI